MSTRDPTCTPDASPRLKADLATAPGAAICALVGDLDLDTRPIAEAALDQALAGSPNVLCVDMQDVHFCDSSGLHILLVVRDRCERRGAALALVAPSARVARLLEITDAGTLFPTFPDSPSAIAELGARA